ncbi:MAG TPA: type VI secretion system membrane subunit TssM, partial [Gammaproteobacteria bacterium]|nr:type VI secretion system membrane subunit TssM [Gammaproteobacteria bacterium]
MKKILGFLTQRWFLTLLGVIALSLFIWFLGPLFAFAGYAPLDSEYSRLIAIGILFIIWLVSRIWAFLRARKKNSDIMQGMVATTPESALTPAEQASKEELQILRERMEEALGELKNARLGSGSRRQFLYQQPWYIIIGPPGSGKTTLLRNSKLKFPLAERFGDQAIRGIGGTRNCDWWFTDDAILLDTAGRYTTQDSQEEVDRKAWLGFLELLKKHRRRRPINGALIAVSIADLLQSSEAERHAHAKAIRNRINELHEHLGIRFPIYLLFTKCDLLAGFSEYFDDLDRDARSQVWGMTFPLSEDTGNDAIKHIDQEFKLLEKRLHGQLIDKLEHEQNLEKRNL